MRITLPSGTPAEIDLSVANPVMGLVIMPDIEKRLEAFLRVAHGLVVFPGGVGTAEEIFYLLGILLDPAQQLQLIEEYGGLEALGSDHTAPHIAAAWA